MKFIKQNKVAVLSIGAIIICFAFFAIPGFAHYGLNGGVPGGFEHFLNGYQFFFNTEVTNPATKTPLGSGIVGSGVAVIVLLGLALISFIFSRKSSFFVMLGGVLSFVSSILFFCMEPAGRKVYKVYENNSVCGWVTYVLAVLMLAVAAYAIYTSIKMMKEEIKHPAKAQGPSYSYLKK